MKNFFQESVSFCSGLAFGLLISILGLWLAVGVVHAATYNVLFNNVEQGPHSSAHPSINVEGNHAKKSNPDVDAATNSAAGDTGNTMIGQTPSTPGATFNLDTPSTVTPATPATPATSVAEVNATSSTLTPRRFKLGFLAESLGTDAKLSNYDHNVGVGLSATYYPLRDFGVTAFGGWADHRDGHFGGEIEFVPVRVGVFGLNNLLEAGVTAGASSLGHEWDGRWGSAHAGLTASLSLGSEIAITAALRSNLTDRSTYTYWLADAGLAIRF